MGVYGIYRGVYFFVFDEALMRLYLWKGLYFKTSVGFYDLCIDKFKKLLKIKKPQKTEKKPSK